MASYRAWKAFGQWITTNTKSQRLIDTLLMHGYNHDKVKSVQHCSIFKCFAQNHSLSTGRWCNLEPYVQIEHDILFTETWKLYFNLSRASHSNFANVYHYVTNTGICIWTSGDCSAWKRYYPFTCVHKNPSELLKKNKTHLSYATATFLALSNVNPMALQYSGGGGVLDMNLS